MHERVKLAFSGILSSHNLFVNVEQNTDWQDQSLKIKILDKFGS